MNFEPPCVVLVFNVVCVVPATSSAALSSNLTSTSPNTTPINQGILSSPFAVMQGRPEHSFVHIHPQPAHPVSVAEID